MKKGDVETLDTLCSILFLLFAGVFMLIKAVYMAICGKDDEDRQA